MKAAFFPGCTVPVRNLNYELSSRRVAAKLGLELVDEPAFQCCGFPVKSLSVRDALALAARNLARAQALGLPIVTLCSACAGTLGEAAHTLDHDDELRREINADLAPLGLEYKPGQKVFHFIRFLVEQVGWSRIGAAVERPLSGFRFAPHYGCHYIKPSGIMEGFDDPLRPQTLHRLIELTGAEAVDDGSAPGCCGGGLLGSEEELANSLTADRLLSAQKAGADGVALICPFCNVMLEGQQKKIAKTLHPDLKMPIFFYPQLLGLALGFGPDELGFKLNRIKNKELIKTFEAKADKGETHED